MPRPVLSVRRGPEVYAARDQEPCTRAREPWTAGGCDQAVAIVFWVVDGHGLMRSGPFCSEACAERWIQGWNDRLDRMLLEEEAKTEQWRLWEADPAPLYPRRDP